MKQKRTQTRLGDFMEGKGFYIALFLCVAAIGISGYYLFNGVTGAAGGFGPDPSAMVSGQAEMEKPQTPSAPDPGTTGAEGTDTMAPKDPATRPDPQAKPQGEPDPEAAASTAYVWPVQGEVARDYSLEVFAYDETMGDWRTHDGLDISAAIGASVSACGNGTVKEVTGDPMLGTTVVIDHGQGMESKYANLAEGVSVQAGDQVKAGQTIGTVGTTAISESASPSHLHFEMIEYGVSIDPLNYLH